MMRFLVVTNHTVYTSMGEVDFTETKPFATATEAENYRKKVLEGKLHHIKNPNTSEIYVKY